MAPPGFVVASFDIECVSPSGAFPLPEVEANAIVQVVTTFQMSDSDQPYKSVIVTLGECGDHCLESRVRTQLVKCDSEIELIEEWVKCVQEEDSDVLLGYNICGFDIQYLYVRA